MSLKIAFIAASIALLGGPAAAQSGAPAPFPNKQLRFIVPFPAGGTLDVPARTVSNELGPRWVKPSSLKTAPARPACSARSWWRAHPPTAIP